MRFVMSPTYTIFELAPRVSHSCNHSEFSFSTLKKNFFLLLSHSFNQFWTMRMSLFQSENTVDIVQCVYSYLNLTNCRISMRLLFLSSSTIRYAVHIRTFCSFPFFLCTFLVCMNSSYFWVFFLFSFNRFSY